MICALIAAAVLLVSAVAFAVPRLRRASRHVDAILRDHNTQTPTRAIPDSKENPAA
ncbi:hypothetical protein [Streptomyces pseudovenezuelae]|uniref:hypothetical protein n=1 Tax=Streptomyces pseudovenezuelae TaxID=67350 RepID=UPI0036EC5841